MTYEVYGQIVPKPVGECGIYKRDALDMQYAVMAPKRLINKVNMMPREDAIGSIAALRDTLRDQLEWEEVPPITGSPLIRGGLKPAQIDEKREYIANTIRFTDTILKALDS